MNTSSLLTPVLGTGLSGLVGSRFVDLTSKTYSFTNMDLSSGVDITNESTVMDVVGKSDASVIIHMAAFVDASRAWQERGDKNGICYKVNVLGTNNIVKAAKEYHKHLIHISTAFVFDGEKDGVYVEEDQPHPIEWYGETKVMAEEAVKNGLDAWTIFRIDQPFRYDHFALKPDTTRKIISGITQGTLYPQFTDHWFSPTNIDDFSSVLSWAIQKKPQGIFHATTGEKVSDYEYAMMIKEALGLTGEVKKGSLDEYLKTSQRPYQRNTAMSNAKLKRESGLAFTPLKEALKLISVI